MNKDALLASIIGFGIGLLITGAVIAGPRVLSQLKNASKGDVASATTDKKTDTTPTPQEPQSDQPLTIESPAKEAIVTESTLNVSGKAPKHAIVVVGSTEDENVVETNETTSYKASVTLKEGKNDVSVVSQVNGKSSIERVTVFYSPK